MARTPSRWKKWHDVIWKLKHVWHMGGVGIYVQGAESWAYFQEVDSPQKIFLGYLSPSHEKLWA